ncbi:MAG: hypothetical protein JJU45_02985 [Acidimicrobiia bacterium]|nr:hypothetical protein [Acidimicrobiia bacterium]
MLRVLDDGPSASLVVTSDGVLPIPACPDTRAARHIARCLNHITGATIDVGPDGTHRGTVTGTGHRVLTTLCVGPGAVLALAQAGVPTLLRRPGAAEAIPLTPSLATTTKEYL